MADSLSATGGEAMVAGTPLELPVVASVEGEQTVPANPGMPEVPSLPEAAVPEAPGSPKVRQVKLRNRLQSVPVSSLRSWKESSSGSWSKRAKASRSREMHCLKFKNI